MAARPAWLPWPNSMCLETTVTAAVRLDADERAEGAEVESSAPIDMSQPWLFGEQPTSSAPPAMAAAMISISRRVGERALDLGERVHARALPQAGPTPAASLMAARMRW